jgi:mevalonate kinase
MSQTIQKAPGKIILFGEHAVVHGQPAIAVPIPQRYATVSIQAQISEPHEIRFLAPDIHFNQALPDIPQDHPFRLITELVKQHGHIHHLPAMRIHIQSTIPVASGLGSGAAVSVALAKALCVFLGLSFSDQDISDIAFEAEKCYHGNPSGIDNTVIAFQKAILFQRGKPIQWLSIAKPFDILIVNSAEQKSTKLMVDLVNRSLQNLPQVVKPIIEQIGRLTIQARSALETGDIARIGALMLENHDCLQQLGVSTTTLDLLVHIAMQNGALGAKLSGAGGGGNMIILADTGTLLPIQNALIQAGFKNFIHSTIQ